MDHLRRGTHRRRAGLRTSAWPVWKPSMKLGVARNTVLADVRLRSSPRSDASDAPVVRVRVGACARVGAAEPVQCAFNPWWLAASVAITVVAAIALEFAIFPILRPML